MSESIGGCVRRTIITSPDLATARDQRHQCSTRPHGHPVVVATRRGCRAITPTPLRHAPAPFAVTHVTHPSTAISRLLCARRPSRQLGNRSAALAARNTDGLARGLGLRIRLNRKREARRPGRASRSAADRRHREAHPVRVQRRSTAAHLIAGTQRARRPTQLYPSGCRTTRRHGKFVTRPITVVGLSDPRGRAVRCEQNA